jgi:YegS/Rv2252/BmrU family lipid kinase
MSARLVFVVNPRSANGATLRRFERVRARFARRLGEIDVRLTERPRHATELARDAVRAGAEAVIAVGGDGTNNEVVNGFFDEAGERIASETAFGVVTSGTGGDFRRTFGWSAEPLDDLERIARFERRRIDLGRIVLRGPDGREQRRHFVNISSFGVSGDTVEVVNHTSKALGAKLSFMAGTVRALVAYEPPRVRLSFDDGPFEEVAITAVAVANGRCFGGGMRIAPAASPDDGLFDVVVIAGGGLSFFLRHGLRLYAGTHVELDAVKVVRARRVRAEPADGRTVLVEIDGEQPVPPTGALPATYEIVPRCIDLLV